MQIGKCKKIIVNSDLSPRSVNCVLTKCLMCQWANPHLVGARRILSKELNTDFRSDPTGIKGKKKRFHPVFTDFIVTQVAFYFSRI